LEVVRELLARGAAVDAARDNGATPLFVASQDGH
jgi:ankyrin repeat protein